MVLDTDTGCRIALALMIVGIAAIGIPHRVRADRVGGRVSRRGDPVWFWIAMAFVGLPLVLTMLGFFFAPERVRFAQLPLPAALRWGGVAVGIAGALLFRWMFRHLGLNVTPTSVPRAGAHLVTSGPYRWVRHPMYVAALILVAATTLLTANLIVLVGGAAMFALLAARSRIEERRLVEKFGDEYRAYQARTGRFIPMMGKSRRGKL